MELGAGQADVRCWPVWGIGRSYAELAAYVAEPRALQGLGLTVEIGDEPSDLSPAERDRRRAARAYELLREKRIAYGWEPRVPRGSVQQVRDPRWLLEDRCGTCLDLAAAYATVCTAAHVGVLLAVTEDHAFVAVTPGRLEGEPHPERALDLAGFAAREEGVLEGSLAALDAAAQAGSVLPVETTWATSPEVGFDRATGFDLLRGEPSQGDRPVRLVDVPVLHATGLAPPLPLPRSRPTIRRYAPGGGERFRAYAGDAETIDRLTDAGDRVVLHADSGQGKSMIARHLVEEAEYGAAWFLDASDPQALVNSLAAARLAEENRLGESPAREERKALAHRALAQLREAEGPWLVVLDNADGDPSKLRSWIPAPREGQQVLVTTTNSEWRTVPGFEPVPLPDVDRSEVEGLGDTGLGPLVRGRRLMLEAFRRLIESGEATAAGIVAAAPPEGSVEAGERLRGPIAYWTALRQGPGFGGTEAEVAAFAAHLPPDRQALVLHERLVEDAAGAIGRLERAGLLARDLDARAVRLHRLFGAAIRDGMWGDDGRAERERVARALATEAEAVAALDRDGDLETVGRLDAILAAADDAAQPDGELGVALHGVAGLLERHAHTRQSGETYARAERHLQGRPELLADCLHGRARTVNQHHTDDERLLRQAVEWSRTARAMLIDASDATANADRCLAMEGLLTKALARFAAPGEARREVRQRALDLLEEAEQRRRARADIGEEERARSYFNLAGIRIDLAKSEPERAAEHLSRAREIYGEVGAWRRRLYDCDFHPHIAACEVGLGYADYYRAMLVPASHEERSRLLREATDNAAGALKQRETLEGPVDLEEVAKVAGFLAKVALARHSSPVAPAAAPRKVFNDAVSELTEADILLEPAPRLPRVATDAIPAIEGWARSRALAVLVHEFGGQPPSGADPSELLEWLGEFSRRWDFRGGKERNLVTAPQLSQVQEKVTLTATRALGLAGGGESPGGFYDHVLILGGLARACLARPLRAARLLAEGEIEAGEVTALGGYRELRGDELGLIDEIVAETGLSDELEAMDAGVRSAFGLGEPSDERGEESSEVGASWRVREYRRGDAPPVRVVAAPSSTPGRRANTADTMEWFARELAHLRAGQRVLAVTSDIYAPYQHADSLRMLGLPFGVEVEIDGIQPGDLDPRLSQDFPPHQYLQETRSTILAYGRLLAALRAAS